ncbi:MAG: cation:proton antiporter [Proteobacteria bacterium]|nr:cation:proton antiporter [Pseudomonadota bacterium]
MHLPLLISDLAYLLGVATAVTLVFRLFKLPVVLGYIVAGYIVGPHFPGPSIGDPASIQVWAELGVIFLMFSLGLEFSFRKLAAIGFAAAVSGVLQVSIMFALGYLSAKLLGWSEIGGLFLGSMVSISSTMIIIKVFEELDLRRQKFASMVFGILIVEDLVAIIILASLSTFGSKNSMSGWMLLQSLGQLFLVIGSWFIIGMFVVPRVMRSVGRHKSNELLVITSTALCLGLVCVAAKFEYSVALGAFLMGSIIAETADVKRIETLIEPLRDIFGAIFFVSIGMLIDPGIIGGEWFAILVISLLIIFGKIFAGYLGSFLTGQRIEDATKIATSKAQIGEFSFIIANLGLTLKVLDAKVFPIIVSASLITTFVSPFLIKNAFHVSRIIFLYTPLRVEAAYNRYCLWFASQTTGSVRSKLAFREFRRWLSCSIVVIAVYESVANVFIDNFQRIFGVSGNYFAWLFAFLISMPFLWAMVFPPRRIFVRHKRRTGRRISIVGSILTILLIGFLSREFLSFLQALALAGFCFILIYLGFRKHLEARYRWFEGQFLAGFSDVSDKH